MFVGCVCSSNEGGKRGAGGAERHAGLEAQRVGPALLPSQFRLPLSPSRQITLPGDARFLVRVLLIIGDLCRTARGVRA
jgi:hypothetical protein